MTPCTKEQIMKEWENSGHICEWQKYQLLLKKFKEATLKGDIKRMAEIKTELHNLCQLCGAAPIPEIMKILEDVELSEDNVSYLRNSLNLIERCADQQDFKTVDILVSDINRVTGCNCQKGTHQETQRKSGFRSQLDAALGTETTDTLEPEPEMRETSGFLRQLSASTRGKKPTVERQNQAFSIIQRQVDFETSLPEVCNDSCYIKRHCGAYPSQVGNLCVKKQEQYRNDKFIQK